MRPDVLIVWDIDDVLVCPVDQILRKSSRALLFSYIDPLKKAGEEYFAFFDSIIWTTTDEARVKGVFDVWQRCSESTARQLALTSPPGGIYGCIKDLAQFRLQRIAELGFDFSRDWEDVGGFVLDRIGSHDKPACFYNGVLFGGTYGKGLILSEFLERHGQGVREVVFIDDKPENVDSVRSAMQNRGISVCGIHYASEDLSGECPADESLWYSLCERRPIR